MAVLSSKITANEISTCNALLTVALFMLSIPHSHGWHGICGIRDNFVNWKARHA